MAAKKPYGDVPYADPGYLDADGNQASKSGKPGVKRYPLSPDKVVAAWSYINQAKNAGQYTPEQLSAIKGRIKAAMAKHGHSVSEAKSAGWLEGALERFNKMHAPAGSSAGGQFAAASGSSAGKAGGKGAKSARPTPSNQHPVGIFGPKTLAAVKAFQKSHGLKVDGLVGPLTTAALRKPAAGHGKPAAAKTKAAAPKPAPHAKTAPPRGTEPAGEERVAGAVTNPGGTAKLHEYWVHGEGAAKIKWGTPGDFDRCVMHLGKFIADPKGYCAKAHHDALGIWPATHAKMEKHMTHFAPDLDVVRSGAGMKLEPAEDGTLGTLTGRFSEFGRWYRVSSKMEGDFLERVAPGATAGTIRDNKDSMRVLFDHGMDAQIGNKVLGPIDVLDERSDGPHYEVPLFDTSYNRDLLPGLKAGVYGASMRMRVTGDEWDDKPARSDANPDGIPERTITAMKVFEFGPVTFPANPGASAGVRSGTDDFYHRLRQQDAPAFEDAMRAAGLPLPEDFTGRDGARSAPGGEEPEDDVQPGNGEPSPATIRAALRGRAWRMRRQPYA
jgi:hypothetical protein